ncbi:Glyoxylate reductase/hydroxypyruvate reductase [Folsomia candida]|uniref:Glyoxylate reductase/hydroxypyruvate reductase n=1 Tax=Folsomia candida TaxID=158441 RepID=A0A226DAW3_FOLCA|nr:Glyoxylate reductase/hydroxypyruvate reductase [Folsomia candida]
MGPISKRRAACRRNWLGGTKKTIVTNVPTCGAEGQCTSRVDCVRPERQDCVTPVRTKAYSKVTKTVTPISLPDITTPRTRRFINKGLRGRRLSFTEEEATEVASELELPKIEGRRIFTTESIEWLMRYSSNHGTKCPGELYFEKETRTGMRSTFVAKCKQCNEVFVLDSDTGNKTTHVTHAAIWATNSTGMGYTALEHFLACLDVPCMASKTYYKHEARFMEDLEIAWKDLLVENGKKEREMAVTLGQVDSDGVAWTVVYADGQWSQRCYNQNGKAKTGSAVIIGALTMLPLFVGVRNSYCLICSRNNGQSHEKCYKNWGGSPQAMEADLIREGFEQSIEVHQLRFKKLIGDGDSSVFNEIQYIYAKGSSPFLEVEKINCVNHAIRRLNTNILSLVGDTGYDLSCRSIVQTRWSSIGKYCQYVIEHNRINRPQTNQDTLRSDIKAVMLHVLGCHRNCNSYFCNGGKIIVPEKFKSNDGNLQSIEDGQRTDTQKEIPDTDVSVGMKLKDPKFYHKLEEIFTRLANHSKSLLLGLTNNIAECFQAQINKFAQGRRVNYTKGGKYNLKVMEATFGFQFGSGWTKSAFEKTKQTLAGSQWTKKLTQGIQRRARATARKTKRKKRIFSKFVKKGLPEFFSKRRKPLGNPSYGGHAEDVGLPESELRKRVDEFVAQHSISSKEEQWKIHEETVGQFANPLYVERRQFMITASIAGRILSLADKTPNVALLDDLLEPRNLNANPAIIWGKQNETKAIQLYEKLYNVVVHRVVTQLHVTGRTWCDFIIWTQGPLDEITGKPVNPEGQLHVTRVYRSNETLQKWNAIRDKAKIFYVEDYAPEIVDPMFPRNMGYRQPTYRLEAYRSTQNIKANKLINTITSQAPEKSQVSEADHTEEPPIKKPTRRRKSNLRPQRDGCHRNRGVARGLLCTVEQDALIKALKTGQIFAAGLDVMTPEPLPVGHELTKLKNCAVLPHIGSATIQARMAMAMLTTRNIVVEIWRNINIDEFRLLLVPRCPFGILPNRRRLTRKLLGEYTPTTSKIPPQ